MREITTDRRTAQHIQIEEYSKTLPDDKDDCKIMAEARTKYETFDVPAVSCKHQDNVLPAVDAQGNLMLYPPHVNDKIILLTGFTSEFHYGFVHIRIFLYIYIYIFP